MITDLIGQMNTPFGGSGRGVMQSFGSWIDVDKESVLWQFSALIQKPRNAFKYFASRRHEKGLWPRGHFRFVIFEHVLLFALSLIYYVFPDFHFSGSSIFWNFMTFVILDFIVLDCLVSSVIYVYLNKWGLAERSYRESRQDVDWIFCLDAFCNGCAAMICDFMGGYVIIHTLELLFKDMSFFTVFLPNTLFFAGIWHSVYLFIETLNVLPFIKKLNYVYFVVPLICFYILSVILGWKLPHKWLALHYRS